MDAPKDRHGSFFFRPEDDGGIPPDPVPLGPDEMKEQRIVLERIDDGRQELFRVSTQLGFHHRPTGTSVVVPGQVHELNSDLTSTPDLFAWLIPKTGMYLPAALVHDGLIYEQGQPPTYTANAVVDRRTADTIFRDAMAVLGVHWARRWLIWATVTLATALAGGLETTDGWWRKGRRTWQVIVLATLGSVIVLGSVATVDLFRDDPLLPWMSSSSNAWQVLGGAAVAIAVPAALALLFWGPVRRAGIIAGIALALLLHVSALILLLTIAFRLLDDPRALWRDTVGQLRKVLHAAGSDPSRPGPAVRPGTPQPPDSGAAPAVP